MNPAAVRVCITWIYFLSIMIIYFMSQIYFALCLSEARVKVGLNLDILAIFHFINIRLSLVIFIMLKKYDEENG